MAATEQGRKGKRGLKKYGRSKHKPAHLRYNARAMARGWDGSPRIRRRRSYFTALPLPRSMWPGQPKKLGLVT